MNSNEIIKLLSILIGCTEAVGETNADKRIENNLKTLIDVADWCLDGIAQSSVTRHNCQYSMRKIGERAFSAMDEWRTWLEERIKDD